MKIEELVPNTMDNWVIKNNNIYYKKGEHHLALIFNDNIINIVIDIKIHKQTVKLIKYLIDKNLKFYLINLNHQVLYDEDYHIHGIKSYLYVFINKEYYYGFKKINFNIIPNLIDWAKDNNCIDKIKECYDSMLKTVNYNYYDYFSNKNIYSYEEEIRDAYSNIYREINIELILK
jgi:hypothetical protein